VVTAEPLPRRPAASSWDAPLEGQVLRLGILLPGGAFVLWCALQWCSLA
jgi:hypothetical protein